MHRPTLRARQFLLSAALMTPIVVAIAVAPPFAAEPRAQGPSHMLGPAFPVVAGADNIVPTRAGNSVTIPSRYACGNTTSNVIALSNPSAGHFLTMSRTNGPLQQSVTITSIVNGTPRQFSYSQIRGVATTSTGAIALRDFNADGVPDGADFTGNVSGAASFVVTPDSNAITVPWSQASALGMDTNPACSGLTPQVYVPLADTNGDGRGDSIVFDLDGNGVADPDLYSSPMIAAPSVPAMGPIARLILMAFIGLIGAWFLARRNTNYTRTTAAG